MKANNYTRALIKIFMQMFQHKKMGTQTIRRTIALSPAWNCNNRLRLDCTANSFPDRTQLTFPSSNLWRQCSLLVSFAISSWTGTNSDFYTASTKNLVTVKRNKWRVHGNVMRDLWQKSEEKVFSKIRSLSKMFYQYFQN